MATQRSAARGKSAKGAAKPAAGRGSGRTTASPPKRPVAKNQAPARKPAPKAAAGKAAAGKAVAGKSAAKKSAAGKSAPGKAAASKATRPGKASSTGKATASKAPASPSKVASSKAPAPKAPAKSSARPNGAGPARGAPSPAGSRPAGKASPRSEAKAAPAPSRVETKAPARTAAAGASSTTSARPSAATSPRPSGAGSTRTAPVPPRPTGGRPLHSRPRLPKGDLGGGETIVLVPARTSDSAGPKAAAPAPRAGGAKGGRGGGERVVLAPSARAAATVVTPVLPLPVRKRDEPMSLEERAESIERRLAAQSDEFRQRYWDTFYMSWIYHDSALEGVVYTVDELRAALGNATAAPPAPPPPGEEGSIETNIQPACEEIRRHREAIDYIRDYAKKKGPITVDVIRKIFLILHPEEGDLKSVKYRRDIPQHRLYFHEYEQPDKIGHKVRQVVDWLNDPETKKGRNGLRIAARAHYDLLRVFPFQSDSGKVSRLFMNLLLLRAGLPPSIILSAERQRYYDALKGSANQILAMVQESVEVALLSIERLLDEQESKARPLVS